MLLKLIRMLDTEFKYYLENQAELVKKYNDRFIVIIGNEVIGDYDTLEQALSETQKEHELGTFLVQRCSEGSKDYTSTFHSRVRIAHATV